MFDGILSKLFLKQKMMRTVVLALIPLIAAGTYFYGLRVIVLLAVVMAAGVATEYLFEKRNKKKVSEAVLVTCILYTLTLPASVPYWIAVVGIVFGVIFGKEVYGGFGRNIFNPALVARAFVYVSFPSQLTISWTSISQGFPGGFGTYLNEGVEMVSQATPMLLYRSTGGEVPMMELLFGNIAGSIGETSKILIILAGIYLIYKKVASWHIMAGCIAGFAGLSIILNLMGFTEVTNPIYGILSGGFLFGTVFMATDPVSSPKTKEGKIAFGILIGVVVVIIRGFSLFAGGMMFAILIGNTFYPIIDEIVKLIKNKKKKKDNKGVAA